RIVDGAALAIGAHLPDHALERSAQCIIIFSAVGGAAHRIQFEVPVLDANTVKQRGQHLNDLSVTRGRFAAGGGRAKRLSADLVKLAEATFLRALAAKLRA